MRNIFVISDTHFNHSNILKFKHEDNYVNVCVEHTNYTPVAIEDIVDGKFKNV